MIPCVPLSVYLFIKNRYPASFHCEKKTTIRALYTTIHPLLPASLVYAPIGQLQSEPDNARAAERKAITLRWQIERGGSA